MAIGRPVKLMWPREEDFTRDQYRPMAVVRVRASLGGNGNVGAWAYRNCSPSITQQRRPTFTGVDSQAIDGATTPTGLHLRFRRPLVEHVVHPSPVPVGYWRSVGHSINTFAIESMIDELADGRRWIPTSCAGSCCVNDARGLAVLDQAASLANWGGAVPSGRARGIALAWAFNSVVAQVVEISAHDRRPAARPPGVVRGRLRPADQSGRDHRPDGGRHRARHQCRAVGAR